MPARRLLVLAAVGAALLVGAPAHAQEAYPPPTDVQGKVAPARIKQGQCTTFSGTGFSPGATITLADGKEPKGTTTANDTGKFSERLCYPGDAEVGSHELSGTGQTASGPQRATATLTITGVEESGGSTANGGAGGTTDGQEGGGTTVVSNSTGGGTTADGSVSPFGLPRTGVPAIAIALVGTALTAAGAFLLLLTERRHRLRRRARTATA